MKISVVSDAKGRIRALGRTEVRPAKGNAASREEAGAAKTMKVGVSPVNPKTRKVSMIELPADLAGLSARDLHQRFSVDLRGKIPKLIRKK